MKILITGGTGFIGTHLIYELIKRAKKTKEILHIDVVDDLSSSTFSKEKKKYFEENNIKFYKSTVKKFSVKNKKYDQIYHLASPVGPAGVLNYAGRMADIILSDSLKMADLAIKNNARLLFISTSEVYGPGKVSKKEGQEENINKIIPPDITVRLEYGVGKLIAEIALLNLAKVSPLKFNIVRPFNIIGPYQNSEGGFVVPRFVQSALKNEPLTVFGNGQQLRCFTHVLDIVTPMILLMNSSLTNKIYNIGNPKNTSSIGKLAKLIIKISKSKSEIAFVDPKKIYGPLYTEAWNKIPKIDLIKKDLKWEPKFALKDIVKEYVDFCSSSKL